MSQNRRKKTRSFSLLLSAILFASPLAFTSCLKEKVPPYYEDSPEDAEELLKSILSADEDPEIFTEPEPEPAAEPAVLPEAVSEPEALPDESVPFDVTEPEPPVQEAEPEPAIPCVPEIMYDPEPIADPHPEWEAEFYDNGLFLYGDAVYSQPFFHSGNSEHFAQTAKYYKDMFGANTRVSVVISPVATMTIPSEKVQSQLADNQTILSQMKALYDPSVNFVDTYSEMYAHRNDYLYFKSDHHWTARGAYYAYCAFIRSVGMEPASLDSFDCIVHNSDYHGSMYAYTQDPRVEAISDTIEIFQPRKSLTMTISTSWGTTDVYTSLFTDNPTYVTFLSGDNPLTVINVPENPQDKSILVMKDSFGNAFVPFLCENYGNIYVVDVRYAEFNVYEQLGGVGLTDIVFVNNLEQANSYEWPQDYADAIGFRFY